jgi:hypothetical protein
MRIQRRLTFFGLTAILAMGFVRAQDLRTVHFKGTVGDYTPSNLSGGPWEIRGVWTMDVDRTGTASFTADLTMETSDYGITSATAVDPNNPSTRSPHTHHITMTNAAVSYDASVCPANSPATGSVAVVISGQVTTAANGGPAPFESKGSSSLQVCITGGTTVSFSNVTLVYTGAGAGHFGSQPIHGVVTQVSTK